MMRHKCYVFVLAIALIVVGWNSATYGVPTGYVSPYNGFCDEQSSADEVVHIYINTDGGYVPDFLQQTNYLRLLDQMAQHLQYTTIDWPDPPFKFTNTADWSDTWGVCAYFDEEASQFWGGPPQYINDEDDVLDWHVSTLSSAGLTTWRLVFVEDVAWGYLGLTDPYNWKLSIVDNYVQEPCILHEYGHAVDTRTFSTGIYFWPTANWIHYGGADAAMNFMIWAYPFGTDGDYAYKFSKYPLSQYWWLTKRFDENYNE